MGNHLFVFFAVLDVSLVCINCSFLHLSSNNGVTLNSGLGVIQGH